MSKKDYQSEQDKINKELVYLDSVFKRVDDANTKTANSFKEMADKLKK